MYDNFASEVGDVICIIVAGPFIPYPNTYLESISLLPILPYPNTYLESISLLPIFYIMITQKTYPLDTYISHMPEYIIEM